MSKPVKGPARSGWRIFRWPLAIGIANVVGLLSALIGDGWYDMLSWLLLGGLLLLMVAAYRRPDST